jgi:hypothetical protein
MARQSKRSRRGRKSCSRNQRGGGTSYYSFNMRNDMSPQLGQPAVVSHNYTASDAMRPGMVSVTAGGSAALPGMGGLLQRGGRYATEPVPLVPGVDAALRHSIPCEGTRSSWPGQRGGASVTMNPSIYEPTAGYGMGVDAAKSALGTPIKIEVPFAARAMTPGCVKVGGRRKATRRGRKGRGKRKATRRGRK